MLPRTDRIRPLPLTAEALGEQEAGVTEDFFRGEDGLGRSPEGKLEAMRLNRPGEPAHGKSYVRFDEGVGQVPLTFGCRFDVRIHCPRV